MKLKDRLQRTRQSAKNKESRTLGLGLKNYLTERRQFVRINGSDSDTHIIAHGVPQGSVLVPTLFSLFTNDLPKSLRSAETYLYAVDTTKNCIAETIDLLTHSLNNVLAELQEWCDRNSMVPHPEKCKAMIVQCKSTFTGPIQAIRLGNNIIKWSTSERLLGVQVDNKLSWSDHAAKVLVEPGYQAKMGRVLAVIVTEM